MNNRTLKDLLYEQVARVGKALASPKRLEMLEMLAQGEKAVETVAAEVAIDVKLASAHLKALKGARLVQSGGEGKRRIYRLSGADVAQLGVTLRDVAEEHLVELRLALQQMMTEPDRLAQVSRKKSDQTFLVVMAILGGCIGVALGSYFKAPNDLVLLVLAGVGGILGYGAGNFIRSFRVARQL